MKLTIPENKVKKYFSLIECWAWCEICKEMVALNINKKEILNGLEMGIYTKEYVHSNPHPDPEDFDDKSGEKHTIYVYIDSNYDVTGVKAFFGDSPSMEALEAAAAASGSYDVRIPIVIKDLPAASVHLGMISAEEYKVLKICDGMNTIEQVAEISQKSLAEIEKMMDKLRKKGLVAVVKRE
ncbi:MAG: hypothetical protein ACFFAN_01645 [Promethearchaeota archaeon]